MFSRQDVFSRMRFMMAAVAGMVLLENMTFADERHVQVQETKNATHTPTINTVPALERDQDPTATHPHIQAATNCEKVYGTSVDFRHFPLSAVLTLVSPAPFEERQTLEGKTIDERLRKWQRSSFTDDWFARDWLPEGKAPEPIAYHFRSPEQRLIGSTVYYEWKIRSVTLRATETSCGLLVEIRDPTFDLLEGIPRNRLERLLKNIFKIPDYELEFLGSGNVIAVNLAELLKLPESVRDGDIFGSMNHPGPVCLQGFEKWYQATMGFATNESICIVLWRPNRLGHLGQVGRQPRLFGDSGFFEDPTWLDGEIFEADGTTRVKVPSLAPATKTADH